MNLDIVSSGHRILNLKLLPKKLPLPNVTNIQAKLHFAQKLVRYQSHHLSWFSFGLLDIIVVVRKMC